MADVNDEELPVVVMKFGGTSVGDTARIKGVADIVAGYIAKNPGTGVVVVSSAMSGETNRLLSLAKNCVETPSERELDVLVATGEQVVVSLLAMRLSELGIPAQSMLGYQVPILTDSSHSEALIQRIDTTSLRTLLQAGVVPVVAGFQGVDQGGHITTLGRGGSDITAVALAAALRAEACFIYTDVTGVFSTDPRMCKNARIMKEVSHEEMLELASLGAKVLHTRSVYFAMRYDVPLVVLSTFAGEFNPGVNGTWIVSEDQLMEQPVVTGITHRLDEARLVVDGMPAGISTLADLFERLNDEGIFIDMISQEHVSDSLVNVSMTIPDDASGKALEYLRNLVPQLGAQGVRVERDIAKVSVVGIGMRYHTGVAARIFSALARERIDVGMINTSEIKVSVIVPRKYCELAVRALHDEFITEAA